MKKQLMDITPNAQERIIYLMDSCETKPLGLRVSLKTKGCSGLSWGLEFVYEENTYDEKLEFSNLNIYIDPKAVLFVLGSVIDYSKTELEEGFVFINPNEKSKCGCGESFMV